MTHIHSNWDKTYTNGITATDCYSGCINITHIDENAIAYEGDNGLDYVPLDWGGNGFTKDVTTIFEVLIPNDNFNLKLVQNWNHLSLNNTIAKVNWGDGTSVDLIVNGASPTVHTYSKAGTYYIKAHLGLGSGDPQMSDLSVFKKILQVSKKSKQGNVYYDFSFFVKDMSNLTYVDCSNLDVSQSVRTYDMFSGCRSLETVIFPKNMVISYSPSMFYGCGKLTSIANYETWDMTKCSRASDMFNGCSSLTSLDLSNWNMSKVTNLLSFVGNVDNLASFYAPQNINVSISDFTSATKLTPEHLMSIINNLNTVSSTQTLTIGAKNLAKLTSNEIKIATDKGWTIV